MKVEIQGNAFDTNDIAIIGNIHKPLQYDEYNFPITLNVKKGTEEIYCSDKDKAKLEKLKEDLIEAWGHNQTIRKLG